jgi:hypothetical protein
MSAAEAGANEIRGTYSRCCGAMLRNHLMMGKERASKYLVDEPNMQIHSTVTVDV